MNLAIVDDNPEELQKLYKTIMDYSRTHDVAIACDCFATSAAFLFFLHAHRSHILLLSLIFIYRIQPELIWRQNSAGLLPGHLSCS